MKQIISCMDHYEILATTKTKCVRRLLRTDEFWVKTITFSPANALRGDNLPLRMRVRMVMASTPARHKPCCRAVKTRATKRSIVFLVAEARPFDSGIFAVPGVHSIEAACWSFGTAGTRLWPRWRRLRLSLSLSW